MAKFTIGKTLNPIGQAELILKGQGLGLLKAQFYNIDYTKASKSDTTGETTYKGSLNSNLAFDAVVFKKPSGAGNQTQTFTGGNGNAINTNEDLVLPIALISITPEKFIVRTNVQGRKSGSVKEYVGRGDYLVSIKGVLVGENPNKRPEAELKKFLQFCNYETELEVVSAMLQDNKIYNLVIESFPHEMREGMRNVIDFTLNCYSDEPFEIKSNA